MKMALAGERSLGWENRDQIWSQRDIVHLEGEFQVNRIEKVENFLHTGSPHRIFS